jgi:uncharacterized Zn finger protein (UPF0148 family)
VLSRGASSPYRSERVLNVDGRDGLGRPPPGVPGSPGLFEHHAKLYCPLHDAAWAGKSSSTCIPKTKHNKPSGRSSVEEDKQRQSTDSPMKSNADTRYDKGMIRNTSKTNERVERVGLAPSPRNTRPTCSDNTQASRIEHQKKEEKEEKKSVCVCGGGGGVTSPESKHRELCRTQQWR